MLPTPLVTTQLHNGAEISIFSNYLLTWINQTIKTFNSADKIEIFWTWNVFKNLDKVGVGSNFEILSFFKKPIYFLKKIWVSSPLYLGLLQHFMPSLLLNDDAETNKPAAPFTPIWALRPTWVLTPYARVRTYFFSVAADEKNKEDAHQRVFLCELRTNKLGLSKKTLLCLDTRCKRVWRRIAIGLSLFSYCKLASIWLCFFYGGSDLFVFFG